MIQTGHDLRIAIFCIASALSALECFAEDSMNYVVAPLSSELHRYKISSRASAIVIVNATGLEAGDIQHWKKLPGVFLEADLRTLAAKDSAMLEIVLQHSGGNKLDQYSVVQLKKQLEKVAKACGYREIQIGEEWTSVEWELGSGALGDGLLEDYDTEDLIVNNTLVAAPLRTRISKLKIGIGDALIELRRPFDSRKQVLVDQEQSVIRQAVQSMGLGSANKLLFQVSCSRDNAPIVEKIFSNRRPNAIFKFEISPALKLAQELGFQEIGCRSSQHGGKPELLLETKAPDFELKSLDNRSVKWSDFRGDRPALISFWGVACGPCRLEAPHLSRLHDKFGADVAILGIHAYDETEEGVKEYVNKEGLKHTVLLGGRELADSTFHVGSYPTTFWINRSGVIVRYEIGFVNGNALETELLEFLSDAQF